MVIGVAPEGFKGAEFFLTPAFYVPLAMLPALDPVPRPTSSRIGTFARFACSAGWRPAPQWNTASEE